MAPSPDEAGMREIVSRMTLSLTHRGPDASGIWVNANSGIALGHRRLSIQDLSAAGAQPMTSADDRYVLIYNGEIYNFQKLSRELQSLGHRFRGNSDTEVLLTSVMQWGVDGALQRFQGMFALAIWDKLERTLVLARDRVGKKPVYYGKCADTLIFGSELKALRAHPNFDNSIDRNALALFLQHSWVPAPRSIYRKIHKLPAGHWLQIDASGKQKLTCYWSAADRAITGERKPFDGTLEEATDALDELLQDAVGSRMIADVSLGSLLSGGYDSTTVTALMQHLSDTPVQTFNIGFSDSRYDESSYARSISQHLGTDHYEHVVSAQEALDLVPRLPTIYDEPFADASQIPTHIVSQLARTKVTVALSGDGGDELFAGYGRYPRAFRDMARWARVPASLRPHTARLLTGCQQVGWKLLQPTETASSMPAWRRIPSNLDKNTAALLAENELELFIRQRARIDNGADLVYGALQSGLTLNNLAEAAKLENPMQGMMLVDLCNYMVDDILVKVDRASMAVSLEARAPFLDNRVVEFAWSLPLNMRYGEDGGKLILRQLLKRYVPGKLTDRPKKGFGVPVADWLRTPLRDWAEELLEPGRMEQDGLLKTKAIQQIWKQHLCGWKDHSDLLWSTLMFQAWLRNDGTALPLEANDLSNQTSLEN